MALTMLYFKVSNDKVSKILKLVLKAAIMS